MAEQLTIGTHNGKFHCDEVFACWMLKQLPDYQNHLILRYVYLNYFLYLFFVFRTRDLKVLETCDIVVDVGAVFDHSKKRYDHHQKYVFTFICLCLDVRCQEVINYLCVTFF